MTKKRTVPFTVNGKKVGEADIESLPGGEIDITARFDDPIWGGEFIETLPPPSRKDNE